jgi:hypothetical protein
MPVVLDELDRAVPGDVIRGAAVDLGNQEVFWSEQHLYRPIVVAIGITQEGDITEGEVGGGVAGLGPEEVDLAHEGGDPPAGWTCINLGWKGELLNSAIVHYGDPVT